MTRFVTILAVFATAGAAFADLAGRWEGFAHRAGKTTRLAINVDRTGSAAAGSVDIPDFGSLGRPIDSLQGNANRFTIVAGPHNLEVRIEGDTLEGTWTVEERDFSSAIRLQRVPLKRPYTEEDVVVQNGDIQLAGTVYIPDGPGPHPGIVLMHGSGDNLRWVRRYHADLFARNGVASVHFDKRGNGDSTGNWRTVGFEPLARDGLAWIEYLQSRSDINPNQVGFWGISQAGWIMPLAASLSDDVAFILVTSGATVSVAEEIKYDYLVPLRDAGYSDTDLARAEYILDMDHYVTMTGERYDELVELVREARAEPWWKLMEFYLLPAGARRFQKLIGGFDPRPILEEVDVPILWIYGADDKSVEPAKSIAILEQVQAEHGKDYTIEVFARANHGIRVPSPAGAAFPFQQYAEGYTDTMVEWLLAHVEAHPSSGS